MGIFEERTLRDDGSCLIILHNDKFQHNPHRTHGIWTLYAPEREYDETFDFLRGELETGIFFAVAYEEYGKSVELGSRWLLAFNEGNMTRRRLKKELENLANAGFSGSWIFTDTGADRYQNARRAMSARSIKGVITEIDYRTDLNNPTMRRIPFANLRES